ncbi:hypothetical protein KKE06_04100 [Candidatus Micrarchaeota archaeon]|nr:hypothetical protein [Candidatus Micrarchaeota archaeon]MBU1930688.1 hypothetical protein [Candidatus Micrarchaeota archaeon]
MIFRLLVAAIVALAFLWIFFTYLAPLFAQPTNEIEKIFEGLPLAKTSPGQTTSLGIIAFSRDDILRSSAFSESGTDTILECNSPFHCCDKGNRCGSKARWDEQQIQFSQHQNTPVFLRCDEQFDFFACTIFVGQKPPQIELQEPSFETTLDLAVKNMFSVSIDIQNTGEAPSKPGLIEWRLLKKTDGLFESPAIVIGQEPFESLFPLETTTTRIEVTVGVEGDYQLHLKAIAEDAGFEEQIIEFQASNQSNPCRALTQQAIQKTFNTIARLCTEKFFCTECYLATHCKQAWEQERPELSFELGDYSFTQTISISTQQECQ